MKNFPNTIKIEIYIRNGRWVFRIEEIFWKKISDVRFTRLRYPTDNHLTGNRAALAGL